MTGAFYNEVDPFAAAWLRELIKRDLIAPGVVDERPIQELKAGDLDEFTQCHFFAGIGVWSHALRGAGWPDDRPVWTGSCPCQPFSAPGKRRGDADSRHLWPVWFPLIRERHPDVVFGEQVSSADGLAWVDTVSADMESEAYAFGAIDTCAPSVGAPHIRQRLYFVADSGQGGCEIERAPRVHAQGECGDDATRRGASGGVGDPAESRSTRAEVGGGDSGNARGGAGRSVEPERAVSAGWLGNNNNTVEGQSRHGGYGNKSGRERAEPSGSTAKTGATRGFWSGAEWINCQDRRYRPIEPGTFPLAHGVASRVGLLRGYGNALVAPLAQAFIESYLDTEAARG